MKINKFQFTVIIAVLLFAADIHAQYGNGYGRRRSAVPQAQETPKEVKPPTAQEIVDDKMPFLTKELGLNEFEKAVVSTTLVKFVQQRIELQILDLEPDKMREGFEKIDKNQNEELKAGLPEDKYNAFLELQKNRFKTNKKKKKKKRKKT